MINWSVVWYNYATSRDFFPTWGAVSPRKTAMKVMISSWFSMLRSDKNVSPNDEDSQGSVDRSRSTSCLIASVYTSGEIIATSHDLTPNGGLAREIPLFQGNLGW